MLTGALKASRGARQPFGCPVMGDSFSLNRLSLIHCGKDRRLRGFDRGADRPPKSLIGPCALARNAAALKQIVWENLAKWTVNPRRLEERNARLRRSRKKDGRRSPRRKADDH